MSDRLREALNPDLIAVIRAAVESGTIKGEVVWQCQHGRGGEKLCREVNAFNPTLHASCRWVLHIPVSDGGSET